MSEDFVPKILEEKFDRCSQAVQRFFARLPLAIGGRYLRAEREKPSVGLADDSRELVSHHGKDTTAR